MKLFFTLFITAMLVCGVANVFAAATVTTASGGSTISADTTGGSYVALIGPVIAEGLVSEINTGTIILDAPSGFIFDTGGSAPTVLVTRTAGTGADTKNINNLSSGTSAAITSRTTAQVVFTITGTTSGGVKNSLTWQDVRVRPLSGTPLATGNITKSGTSAISGITNGTTNLGALTEVTGAKIKLFFTAQPSASATAGSDFAMKPVIAVEDQFGNTVTSDNTTPITLTAVLSAQTCGGTAGSGILSLTPVSGAAVTGGQITYTAAQYSIAEDIKICATSADILSALSNAVSVSAAPSPPGPPPPSPPVPPPPGPPPPTPPVPPTPSPAPSPVSIGAGTGGGSPELEPTTVRFLGRAYPNATVLVIDRDIKSEKLTSQSIVTQDDGTFEVKFVGVLQSQHSFGLIIKDSEGQATQTKFFNIDTLADSSVIKDIFAPPTLSLIERLVTKGSVATVSGYASPGSLVKIEIDGVTKKEERVKSDGHYLITIDTAALELASHRVRAKQVDSILLQASDYSPTQTLIVSRLTTPRADLSGDGRIDIQDWSMFMARWTSQEKTQGKTIDFNGDGKVDISDFSIFIRAIKK
jgi:hypothetical protein